MSEVTRYVFVLNGMEDKTWTGLFQIQDHEAPPGKAVRIKGRPDSESIQFKEADAKLLLSTMEPEVAARFVLSQTETEIKKDELKPAPAPKAAVEMVPNASDQDYPEGDKDSMVPVTMEWNRPQLLAWLRDNDDKLLKKIKKETGLSIEGIVLKIWEVYDKPKYDRYMETRKG